MRRIVAWRSGPTAPALLCLVLTALLLLGTPPARAGTGTAAVVGPSACALPGTTGWTDEGHGTDRSVFQRSTGTIRVAMVFVDFPDAPATESPASVGARITPGADWMWNASYGKVWPSITPYQRWVRMPQRSTDYGFARGLTHETHEAYLKDAVAAADPYVDFSRHDMVYVVPTRNASAISFSPTYIYEPGTRGVVADGSRMKWAVTFGQDMWRWDQRLVGHETAHTFGLPDLYAFDAGSDAHRFTGGWDVMGLIGGAGPQYFGWHSWKLGWTDDDQVLCRASRGSDTVRLTAVAYHTGTKIAVIRTGPTTAYVVESRRAVNTDAGARSTGALVYKVDSSVPTGEGPVRVMDAHPHTTPAGGRPLDDAPFRAGQSFTDHFAGVRVEVLSSDGSGDTVRVTKR
ncbi:peptidase M6 [Streptomyces sp. NPDC046261]|uniref:peptidase M6 n=1 Tax=Streptomyces sp. NPDC046261 TaxID=3157200 RepID=UPI0033F87EEB